MKAGAPAVAAALLIGSQAGALAAAQCSGNPPYPANPAVSYDYRQCDVHEYTVPNTAPVPLARDLSLAPLTNVCKNCNLQGPSCNLAWSAEAESSVSAEVEAGVLVAGVAVTTQVSFGVSATSGCDSGPITKCKTAFVNLGLTAHAEYTRQSRERFEGRTCFYYQQRGGFALWEWLVTDTLVLTKWGKAKSCGLEYDDAQAKVTVGGSCAFREGPYPCPDPQCPDCCPTRTTGEPFGAVPTPPGSRLVMTGEVVAGQPATLSVVGPGGQFLSGVVVAVNGEQVTSGPDGRAVFTVAAAATTVAAGIHGLEGAPQVEARVIRAEEVALEGLPQIDSAPRYPVAGSEFRIDGGPFEGVAADNSVRVGDRELPVLASCPTQLVTSTARDWPVGFQGPLTVTTAAGTSEPVGVTFVRLRLEEGETVIPQGQTVRRKIFVDGTEERVRIRLTNLTPQVVRLTGGESIVVRTGGGSSNFARIRLTGVTPARFELTGDVIE